MCVGSFVCLSASWEGMILCCRLAVNKINVPFIALPSGGHFINLYDLYHDTGMPRLAKMPCRFEILQTQFKLMDLP